MSDVVWDVVSDMVSDIVWDVVSDVMSDVMSDVVSDIALQNRPAIHTVSSGWNSHQVPGSRFQVPGSINHQSSIINLPVTTFPVWVKASTVPFGHTRSSSVKSSERRQRLS
jgi:hypothetical protein